MMKKRMMRLPRCARNDEFMESGRSMIEMLAVLAIVGVLSAGGIVGYSKAMEKFKAYKTNATVSMIMANVRTAYSKLNDFSGLDTTMAAKLNIISKDMMNSDNTKIVNPFKGLGLVGAVDLNAADGGKEKGAFAISFDGIGRKYCNEVISSNWGDLEEFVGILIDDTDAGATIPSEAIASGTLTNGEIGSKYFPLPPTSVLELCGEKNTVTWFYK